MMTRKHFQALAEALEAQLLAAPMSLDAFDAWLDCVHRIARVCAESNPRFDRERFLQTCGVK